MTQTTRMNPATLVDPAVEASPARRWEPWPIGIAVFLAVFVAGAAIFIVFAVRQRMDLVRADYYEEEIRYQVQFDRLGRTRELGPEASLQTDLTGARLEIRIPKAHVATRSAGTIQLYRPSDAASDRSVNLDPSPAGTQVVSLAGLEPGLWRAKVRWTASALEYHMEQSIIIPKGN